MCINVDVIFNEYLASEYWFDCVGLIRLEHTVALGGLAFLF